jgi:DNA end-binding protein Ku
VAATVWKGFLTFGLVSVPIRLFTSARSERISFNQLHKECGSLRQPLFCPTCNRMVERTEVIKGYEHEKDQYVLVSEEEVEKIAPPSSSAMEILEFVPLTDVDPIYYENSYLVVPEPPGRRAYDLIVKTLEKSGYAAIAKLYMHQREYTAILRPRAHGLTLHTIYYPNEIRQVAEYGQTDGAELKEQELKLAQNLVENLAAKFEPEKYSDEYQGRVKALIDAKLLGREITEAPRPQLAPVIDLMEALKKSLAQQESAPKKPPLRAVAEMGAKRPRKKTGS